jgi:hypothetical protein
MSVGCYVFQAEMLYILHGGTGICLSNFNLRQYVTILLEVSDIFKFQHPSSSNYMTFVLLELMVQSPMVNCVPSDAIRSNYSLFYNIHIYTECLVSRIEVFFESCVFAPRIVLCVSVL